MKAPAARRAGVWLTIYAAGGSLVGVAGFGMLWSGLTAADWARAVVGLALLLLGLDRAGTALHLSLRSVRAVAAAEGTKGDTTRG
jgi:hypothetical protein